MKKRICLIGAGNWGRNHLRTLAKLECLAGVVDNNPERLRSLSAELAGVEVFDSVSTAIERDFDGFVVATPAHTHYSIGKAILEAGKPALIEKPLALSSQEARDLSSLAQKKGVVLMVGHVLLFHPAIRRMKELVDEGKLGKLQYIYSNRLNLGTVRTEENILWSFAPHDISVFQYLVGELPVETRCDGAAFLQPHVHDTTVTFLRYPDNVVAHIFVSWLHPFKEHRLVVIGSKGMLSFEDTADRRGLMFYEKGIDWIEGNPKKREGPTERIDYPAGEPLALELTHFIESLGTGKVEFADPRSAVEVLEILEHATSDLIGERSAPHKEKIPNDYYAHPSSTIDANVRIGKGTKVWHYSHVQSGAVIGDNCSLGQNVNVANNVRIGNSVKIQNNVSIYEGVELQDYVFCGPSMVFTNVRVPRSKYPQRGTAHYARTLVKEGASIGANATIVCGHSIGRHAFISAGAVVTKDVPDYALMVGVPARQAGWVCECGERLVLAPRCTCSRCGIKYVFDESQHLLSPVDGPPEG